MKRSLLLARQWTRAIPVTHHLQFPFHHVHFSPVTHASSIRVGHLRNAATMSSSDDPSVNFQRSTNSKRSDPKLLERTKYLLDPSNQLDATDPDLWTEADQILRAWLDENSSPDLSPLKRVECCLRLLDRLSNTLPKEEMFFISLLGPDIMSYLLKVWRVGLTRRTQNEAHLRRLLTPSFLAAKIDKYRWTSLFQPDSKTFNLLLNTAPMFPYRDGLAFADSLLCKLVEVSRDDDNNELPLMDTVSVATVMQAWVNYKQPDKAEEWLNRLESWKHDEYQNRLGKLLPNKIVYTIVLSGWAKVGNAQRAIETLERQLSSFLQGNHDCRPDTTTFNCVLDALAKSNDPSGWAVRQAKVVLERMKEFCIPDAHTWTTLIACYAKHKPSEAEKLLRQLEEKEEALHIAVYNAMLHSYSRRGDVKAATKLLEKLEASNDVSPNIVTYNTVLSAYSRRKTADAALEADAFFRRILGQKDITPTVATYGAMMQCWSRSNDIDAADRAEAILRGMNENGPAPNTACYNIVLSAWGIRQWREGTMPGMPLRDCYRCLKR